MATIVNTKLGENRGKRRLWLEGAKLAREGYRPDDRYDLDFEGSKVVIKLCNTGKYKVSRRERNGRLIPIIDISNQELVDLFDGVDMLRVLISKGRIVVTAHHQQEKVVERVERLLSRLKGGVPLRVASLFHGGGILDKALHSGLDRVGVPSKLGVAVEIEPVYLDASLSNNPELWDEQSIAIESPVQRVDLGRNPPAMDILCAGVPCVGASKSGRSKNKLKHAEEHEAAGAMFFSFLEFAKALNPAVILGENVPEYADSASMAVIRSVLASLGYDVQERVLDGNEFGALEKRKRFCFVAVSQGLEQCLDLDAVIPHRQKEATLQEALLPFARVEEERWKDFSYLETKAKRDAAQGKGFKRQLLTGSEASCGTIGRGYAKGRSTEPFLRHPHDMELSRLFTPLEHAALKAVPGHVIAGLSDTRAHEVLGQSVIYPKFEAVGMALGRALRQAAGLRNDHLVEVRAEVLNPFNGGTIGGEDLDYVPATLNLLNGHLRLVGEGRQKGWLLATTHDGLTLLPPVPEANMGGKLGTFDVIGDGPEFGISGMSSEEFDYLEKEEAVKYVRTYGDSYYIDVRGAEGHQLLRRLNYPVQGHQLLRRQSEPVAEPIPSVQAA